MRPASLLLAFAACSESQPDQPDAGVDIDASIQSELVVAAQMTPTLLAQTSTDLVFASTPLTSSHRVLRIPKTGGMPTVIGTADNIYAVTTDGEDIFWLERAGQAVRLMSLPAGSPGAASLGTSQFFNGYTTRNLTTDADAVYYADISGYATQTPKLTGGISSYGMTDAMDCSVASSPDGIWIVTTTGAKLLPDGAALQFSSTTPASLLYDGALYASLAGSGAADGSIVRVAATGQTTTVADNLASPTLMASRGGTIYVITGTTIQRVPQSGGTAEAVATGQGPAGLVVDDNFVYWTEPSTGELRKVQR